MRHTAPMPIRLRQLLAAISVAIGALLALSACAVTEETVGQRVGTEIEQVEATTSDSTDEATAPAAEDTADDDTNDVADGDAADAAVDEDPGPEPQPAESVVAEQLEVTIVERTPHDSYAFTQGLELTDGRMFESTGSPTAFFPNSTTSIREVDPETGEVLRKRDFGSDYFGEGLTLVGDSLVQLSWQQGEAYVFDQESFEITGEFTYDTEGWGLCHDGERFVMSDGSGTLYLRNSETFAIEEEITVLRNGVTVTRLNELECVDGQVWSNIWYGNEILRIDPENGAVTGVADLSPIAQEFTAVHSEHVLNGIAFDDASDSFIITGKRWSEMLRVEFQAADS